jgi:hypothetical protein
MDETTLNNLTINISYINNDLKFYVNPFLGSEFSYDQQNKTLIITPKGGFLPNQEVEVKLTPEVKSKNGKRLARSGEDFGSNDIKYAFKFKTATE